MFDDAREQPDPLKRNAKGALQYTPEVMRELLTRLVERTGGVHNKEGLRNIPANPPQGKPKDTEIIKADQLVRECQTGVVDPYMEGLIAGEDHPKVDPRQYSCLNEKCAEHTDLGELNRAMAHYKRGTDKETSLNDLVVFKPDRMAMHWVAILTAMHVKTHTPLPDRATATSKDYDAWMQARDTEYVQQVNEIYFKLFGIDHTHDKTYDTADSWPGHKQRLEQVTQECENIRSKVTQAVNAMAIGQDPAGLTADEIARVQKTLEMNEDKALATTWVTEEIYRKRANEAISVMMEEWFKEQVFAPQSGFEKKTFIPKQERETFVLTGGSATGKSKPMSLLAEKLAKGFDTASGVSWKKDGTDLNDIVYMKSETMRSLLLEKDFLDYGNRLFMDESAHEERAIIRGEMFRYLHKMLDGKSPLVNEGQAPLIVHDRRSFNQEHFAILTHGGARLNAYYFSVRAANALERNRMRGASDLQKFAGDNPPDMATYAPRFVNARNNISSQEGAARRILEMIETKAGQDILVPLYSTEVDFNDQPFVIGYADLKEKTIHIRRLPRLLDIIDNTHFVPPLPTNTSTPNFAQTPLDGMIVMPKTPGDLLKRTTEAYKNAPRQTLSRQQREEENARLAAHWLAHLSKDLGYSVYISTPHVEKRTHVRDTVFAEIHPPAADAGDGAQPRLYKLREDLIKALKQPQKSAPTEITFLGHITEMALQGLDQALSNMTGVKWGITKSRDNGKLRLVQTGEALPGAANKDDEISRYKLFLDELDGLTSAQAVPAVDWTQRVKSLLFEPDREYRYSRSYVAQIERKDAASTNLSLGA